MDNEFKRRLEDFFDAWNLIEFLQVETKEVIDAFEDEIENCAEELEEFMEIGVRR